MSTDTLDQYKRRKQHMDPSTHLRMESQISLALVKARSHSFLMVRSDLEALDEEDA